MNTKHNQLVSVHTAYFGKTKNDIFQDTIFQTYSQTKFRSQHYQGRRTFGI